MYTIFTCEWTYIVTHVPHIHLRVDKYCYTCTPFPLASGQILLQMHMYTIPTCEWTYIVTRVHHFHLRVDIYCYIGTHHSHLRVDKYCCKCTCIPYPLASEHKPKLLFIAVNHMRVDIYYNTDTPFPSASGHTLVLQLLYIHRHYPLASGHTLLHIYTIPTCEWTYTPIAIHRHYPLASGYTLLHMCTLPTCEWTYITTCVHHSHLRVDIHWYSNCYSPPLSTCEWIYFVTHIYHSHLRVDIHPNIHRRYPLASGSRL